MSNPGGRGGKFKLPTLTELHQFLFHKPFGEAHNATADVEATTRCFLELIRRKEFTIDQLQASNDFYERFQSENPEEITPIGIKHINLKQESAKIAARIQQEKDAVTPQQITTEVPDILNDVEVVHLHNHSQFSVLQSTMSVQKFSLLLHQIIRCQPWQLTDHGNMMGAFHFVKRNRQS